MMLRPVTASTAMHQALPLLAPASDDRFGGLVSPRRRAERALIEPSDLLGLTVLAVFQAVRHRDEEFGWTALWVLRSAGHVLHCQAKRGQPVRSVALSRGTCVVFDAEHAWHWTTGGSGMLVVAPVELGTSDLDDAEVRGRFDAALSDPRCAAELSPAMLRSAA